MLRENRKKVLTAVFTGWASDGRAACGSGDWMGRFTRLITRNKNHLHWTLDHRRETTITALAAPATALTSRSAIIIIIYHCIWRYFVIVLVFCL